jgi:hypothetical protein
VGVFDEAGDEFRRGIRHAIPERRDQAARRAAKGSAGGRPPDFSPQAYKQRNASNAHRTSRRRSE